MSCYQSQSAIGRAARRLAGAVLLGLLGACGGSGSGPAGTPETLACNPGDPATADACGALYVTFTDAQGDILSYTADVLSLTLTKANGTVVETLPAATRLDFAQYADLTEFVAAASVPPGSYVGGTVRLDYSNAEVYVAMGGAAVAADVVGSDNQPLGVSELEIQLDERAQLVITRGRAALLTVDFDLAASHQVDLATNPPRVIAEPFLVAEVEPVDEKDIRLRGALISVDAAALTYDVKVRPWHRRDGDFGRITVQTDTATTYEVDGATYVGEEGLRALDAAGQGTPTVAFGTLDASDRSFSATIVHAGSSVVGEDTDAVYGNVIARDADRLTVAGATVVRPDGTAVFRDTITVLVGPQTRVAKTGMPDADVNYNSISVGQRIVAFGEFQEPAPLDFRVLDATEGGVRMLVTRLLGRVVGMVPGQIDIALRAIDRRSVEIFNFQGTGQTRELDADPARYEVRTAALSLDNFMSDSAVKAYGFVTPFGVAPPDFEGRTLVDFRQLRAALGIGWGSTGTDAPFSMLGSEGLVLDLSNQHIDQRHHMLLGDRKVDLFDLSAPLIVPPATGRTVYTVVVGKRALLFRSFDDFVVEVRAQLGNGAAARSMASYGSYDEATNTLTANKIAIRFIPPEA